MRSTRSCLRLWWRAALLVLAIAPAALAKERVALLIGNAAYDEIGALRNPVNDVRLMARTLRELGFEVAEHTDADQAAMKRAIQDFGRRLEGAGRDAVGLFYYAGHGVQVNGVNYLIPLRARIEREADVEIEAVNADWVLAQMDYAGNRINFVILDACRNNPFARSFRSVTRGLAPVDAPRGTLVAYSTAPGEVSVDGIGTNSPYTEALADALRQPGLVAEEVFRTVRVEVLRATRDRQTPWEASSLTGAFHFVPAEQLAPATTAAALEEAFWDGVKESADPVLLRHYLERFPDGRFADRALEALAAVEAAPDPEPRPSREFEIAALDTRLYAQARTNVRALPTTESERLTTLAPGHPVEVSGRVRDRDWYEVRLAPGRTGFIWAPLLGGEAPAPPRLDDLHARVDPPPPRTVARPHAVAGRWEGSYRCQRDNIGLALDITEGEAGRISAVFEFFPLPGSPSFPRGRFSMSGGFDAADRSLHLRSERWIKRPLGFQSHDLEGRLERTGATIHGRILTTGCTHFSVTRR